MQSTEKRTLSEATEKVYQDFKAGINLSSFSAILALASRLCCSRLNWSCILRMSSLPFPREAGDDRLTDSAAIVHPLECHCRTIWQVSGEPKDIRSSKIESTMMSMQGRHISPGWRAVSARRQCHSRNRSRCSKRHSLGRVSGPVDMRGSLIADVMEFERRQSTSQPSYVGICVFSMPSGEKRHVVTYHF